MDRPPSASSMLFCLYCQTWPAESELSASGISKAGAALQGRTSLEPGQHQQREWWCLHQPGHSSRAIEQPSQSRVLITGSINSLRQGKIRSWVRSIHPTTVTSSFRLCTTFRSRSAHEWHRVANKDWLQLVWLSSVLCFSLYKTKIKFSLMT